MNELRIAALVPQWRAEADTLRTRYADEGKACLLEAAANDLEQALRVEEERTYNLTEAAAATGYTADYLGKLVRRGSIPNRGRKSAPSVRLSDCPRRRTVVSLLPMMPALHVDGGSKELVARAVVANS
jgi:hypothetical protein